MSRGNHDGSAKDPPELFRPAAPEPPACSTRFADKWVDGWWHQGSRRRADAVSILGDQRGRHLEGINPEGHEQNAQAAWNATACVRCAGCCPTRRWARIWKSHRSAGRCSHRSRRFTPGPWSRMPEVEAAAPRLLDRPVQVRSGSFGPFCRVRCGQFHHGIVAAPRRRYAAVARHARKSRRLGIGPAKQVALDIRGSRIPPGKHAAPGSLCPSASTAKPRSSPRLTIALDHAPCRVAVERVPGRNCGRS